MSIWGRIYVFIILKLLIREHCLSNLDFLNSFTSILYFSVYKSYTCFVRFTCISSFLCVIINIIFLFSVCTHSLVVYRNKTDFFKVYFISYDLPEFTYQLEEDFFVNILVYSIQTIISYISSFLISMPFVSFFFFSAQARTSSIMLNNSGEESRHLFHFHSQEERIQIFTIKYVNCRFFVNALYPVEKVSSTSILQGGFYFKIITEY